MRDASDQKPRGRQWIRTRKEPGDPGECIDLFLYVTNRAPPCLAAFANLRQICEEYLKRRCRITVIDLENSLGLTATDGILAVPTLVRNLPGRGKRRVIGTPDEPRRVLSLFGLANLNGRTGATRAMEAR